MCSAKSLSNNRDVPPNHNVTKANAKGNAKALMVHVYCVPAIMETKIKGENTLHSPSKTPIPPKKQKGDGVASGGTREEGSPNNVILAAIGAL